MEPTIYPTLTKYVNAGGNPDNVVDYLSSNYDAIAQTSNLLAEWLLMTDINISEVQTSVEENLKKMIIKYFDPKKADSIFLKETSGVCSNANLESFILSKAFYTNLDTFLAD